MPHSMLCLVCGPVGGADVLQNILLFLPLGVGLGMMRMPGARGMALILVTTGTVELLQATVLGGRFASLGDIVANSAGGALGLWTGWHDSHWAFPAPRTRRSLARASLAVMLLLLIVATASIRRIVPSGPLTLRIAPTEAHGRRFEGCVSASSLGAQPIAPGRVPPAIEQDFRQKGGTLSMSVISGLWVEYESSIAVILDRQWRGLVRVSQDGSDAVLAVYVAGNHAGLRGPRLVLPAALPPSQADTVRIDAEVALRRVALTVRAGDTVVTRALTMGPSTAWMVLYPFGYGTSAIVAVVSLAWLAILTVPAGYWSGMTRVRTGEPGARLEKSPLPPGELAANLVCVAIFTIIGLGIAPFMLGFAPAPAAHWLAPLGGFAMGAAAGRIASRAAR